MKLLELFKKTLITNEEAANAAKETADAAKNRAPERALVETEATKDRMNYIIGQVAGVVLETDPNNNNPVTVKDYLGFTRLSSDVNFIVEYNGHAVGLIGGCEIKGCSDRATAKWLESLEYSEEAGQDEY
ncbi:MAG: hypothetical protein FWE68_05190 [Defluviitaleaceae bacterium]|nr:hypothetical protein [Defluviitaleaceae bacterium]